MSDEYAYCGMFTNDWNNPPKPFNPLFDPLAKQRYGDVSKSMEEDGFYDNHTRAECKAEWRLRYETLKAAQNGL